MTIFDENLILETINMIKLYNFDIRTVTLAVSLRDCLSENIDIVCDKIKLKLDKYACNLVKYANELENDYSIPIVNKRIAVTPISLIGESCSVKDYIKIAKTLDNSAKNLDKETHKCKIHRNRPGICRRYPQEEVFAMGGTLAEHCGYKLIPVQSFEEVFNKVQKKYKG